MPIGERLLAQAFGNQPQFGGSETKSALNEHFERQRQQELDRQNQENEERDFGFKLTQRRSAIAQQVIGLIKSGVSDKDAVGVADPEGILTPGMTSSFKGISNTFQEQGADKELDDQAKTYITAIQKRTASIKDAEGPEQQQQLIELTKQQNQVFAQKSPKLFERDDVRQALEQLKTVIETAPAAARDTEQARQDKATTALGVTTAREGRAEDRLANKPSSRLAARVEKIKLKALKKGIDSLTEAEKRVAGLRDVGGLFDQLIAAFLPGATGQPGLADLPSPGPGPSQSFDITTQTGLEAAEKAFLEENGRPAEDIAELLDFVGK